MVCASALCLLALAPAAQARATVSQQYYVSLGDSYAVGYQPSPLGYADGFVYQVPGLAKKRGYQLKVVNFGALGATTTSMMASQIGGATKFIRANPKRVALITVSIGGNDVAGCSLAADPLRCVGEKQAEIRANVSAAAKQLRAAAGSKTVIVGTTYPNVFLGAWVSLGRTSGKKAAATWTKAFKGLINPELKASYAQGRGKFVDVTAKTGAYGDMRVMKTLAPYGSIPKPVAEVCELTWACSKQDRHPNKAGYEVIAKMVVGKLPKR